MIENWGDTVAWGIRGGMIAVGAGLYFLSPSGEQEKDAAEAE
ncbi:MAG: hypothetical protein ABFS30_05425 [Pseudomonadota bacterium]